MKHVFWIDRMKHLKLLLVAAAALLSVVSLMVSHALTRDLYKEEVAKMDVWAEAMRSLQEADENTDLNLVLKVINSNNTIPVVVLSSTGDVLATRNLWPSPEGSDSLATLRRDVEEMKLHGQRMRMDLKPSASTPKDYIYVLYEESVMLRRLTLYPYIQLVVVVFFGVVCLLALLASKRAEQDRVWVGLSRETAHQLGTPISSLMAWSEVLRESYPHDPLLPEMDKDVHRLQLIAERFSKIGSAPELEKQDVRNVLQRVTDYLDHRTSRKVTFDLQVPTEPVWAQINAPLFEWVIENLCKNAVDAMQGEGHITIKLENLTSGMVGIDVTDTGKGIPHKHFSSVFKPGFTTKKRGWGLGLSLAKRIVEEYHNGSIFVKDSILGKGTTFRIEIK